jgi:hypothetical protein
VTPVSAYIRESSGTAPRISYLPKASSFRDNNTVNAAPPLPDTYRKQVISAMLTTHIWGDNARISVEV